MIKIPLRLGFWGWVIVERSPNFIQKSWSKFRFSGYFFFRAWFLLWNGLWNWVWKIVIIFITFGGRRFFLFYDVVVDLIEFIMINGFRIKFGKFLGISLNSNSFQEISRIWSVRRSSVNDLPDSFVQLWQPLQANLRPFPRPSSLHGKLVENYFLHRWRLDAIFADLQAFCQY